MEDIVNSFNSEEDILEEQLIQNFDPLAIKSEDYHILKIIKYFQELKHIKQQVVCHICLKEMKLEKNNLYIDKYCWRCRAFNPKYDIRINLRAESFYEGMRIPLNGLYYLINNCFINQYTINRSYNEMEKFTNLMKMQKVSKKLDYYDISEIKKKNKRFL